MIASAAPNRTKIASTRIKATKMANQPGTPKRTTRRSTIGETAVVMKIATTKGIITARV